MEELDQMHTHDSQRGGQRLILLLAAVLASVPSDSRISLLFVFRPSPLPFVLS